MIKYIILSILNRMANKGAVVAVAAGARKRSSEFDRLGPEEAGKIAVEGMHTIQV